MDTISTGVNLLQVAEIDIIYKSKVKPSLRPQIKKLGDGADIFRHYWDKNKIEYIEQFKVMLLNRARYVLGIYEVSTGSITGTIADPKLVFSAALKMNASYLILCHNHPSGNLTPSTCDKEMTARMQECGRLLDVPVIDHLIISMEGFFSFQDEGMM
jgi:DNA repair protein RadC